MRKFISARSVAAAAAVATLLTAGGARGDFIFGDFEDGLDPNLGILNGTNRFNGSVAENATHGTKAGSFTTDPGWTFYLQYNNGDKSDAGVFGQLQYYNDISVDINVPAGTEPSAFFVNEIVFNSTGFGWSQSGNVGPSDGGNVDVKGAGTVTLVWPYRQKIADFETKYQQQMAADSPYFQVNLVANWGNGWDGGAFTLDNIRLSRLLGDANLNGTVDADDYVAIDRSIAAGGGSGWAQGDFNYDGSVNASDYALIDKVYAHQGGAFSAEMLADRAARFGEGYVAQLVAGVPEPTIAVGGVVVAMAGVRRRRGNR